MLQKPNKPINFIDLKSQQNLIRPQIDAAIKHVLDHGQYIMGPEIFELEKNLSSFCGAKHTISCANGTDALGLILLAKGIKKGDAVFVPSFTFAATAEVVVWTDATPIFIDVLPDTFNMDPQSLKQGIQTAKKRGLTPAAIIPVDLFGAPADYDALETIALDNNIWILSDAAQSFGAVYKDKKVGTCGLATSASFFPAKPLGCYGDGGAIFTDSDPLAEILKSLRVHGQGKDKYDNIRIGMNGRLDTLQAAILIEKLKVFPTEIMNRQKAADHYTAALKEVVQTPYVLKDTTSVWAQYTICVKSGQSRDKLITYLNSLGIPTAIHYAMPLHHQKAYEHYPTATDNGLPIAEDLSKRVLSLPIHGYLDTETLNYVTDGVLSGIKNQ